VSKFVPYRWALIFKVMSVPGGSDMPSCNRQIKSQRDNCSLHPRSPVHGACAAISSYHVYAGVPTPWANGRRTRNLSHRWRSRRAVVGEPGCGADTTALTTLHPLSVLPEFAPPTTKAIAGENDAATLMHQERGKRLEQWYMVAWMMCLCNKVNSRW
jgi:hypothetical protein